MAENLEIHLRTELSAEEVEILRQSLVRQGKPSEQLVRSLAMRRANEVLRHIGVDPDGPNLVPMRPASDWCIKAEDKLHARCERHRRDAWLRRAIRFT